MVKTGDIVYVNRAMAELTGYSLEELTTRTGSKLNIYPDKTQRQELLKTIEATGQASNFPLSVRRQDGELRATLLSASTLDFEGQVVALVALDDVTRYNRIVRQLEQSEHNFRSLVINTEDGISVYKMATGERVYANQRLADMTGYSVKELLKIGPFDLNHPEDRERVRKQRENRLAEGSVPTVSETRYLRRDGSILPVELSVTSTFWEDEPATMALVRDITERNKWREQLQWTQESLKAAQRVARLGSWTWDIQNDRLWWSEGIYAILGQAVSDDPAALNFKNFLGNVHPEDRDVVWEVVGGALKKKTSFEIEHRIVTTDGTLKYVNQSGEVQTLDTGEPVRMTGTMLDITDRKEFENKLEETIDNLHRSNQELEQFAYVASHDLQEPLRMVSSYSQLLARRYQDKLDQDANDFIGFAVDGAHRMQILINDLLSYSRITTRGRSLDKIDAGITLGHALNHLKLRIEEEHASVTHDALPAVLADEVQLTQVFQNLLGNAIKFRGEAAPRIHIAAEDAGDAWQLSVADNGIGIDPQYAERIFLVFQRLHRKEDYEGTGIGLALCKKIVERHGGQIWVESQPGQGATFKFTLPKPGAKEEV
jgi:PAS domain S-box-containing protein